jgi:sulfotransferase family protein
VTIEPPFFIVGSPRAGTTLLSRILDRHSRLAVYHETHYYPLFRSEVHRYGNLHTPANLKRFLEDVREVTRIQGFMVPPSTEALLAALPAPTFEGVLTALLWLHARQRGKVRAGDKTPGHHAYLAEILKNFSESPVVFVLRDPRDAVHSMRRALGVSLKGASWMWNQAFQSYVKFSECVHLVRYEDLVADPKKILPPLCAALGQDFENDMLRFFERIPQSLAGRPNFSKLLKDIDTESVGNFNRMAADDVRQIEAVCAQGMEALGYPFTTRRVTTHVSMQPPSRIEFIRDRLRYYGTDRKRWRRGWMHWKIALRLRLRSWLPSS